MLTDDDLLQLYDAQVASRALDLEARRLKGAGRGVYTIGSAGHEANAAVACAVRPGDPALLHYRSGAFYLARSAQVRGGLDEGVRDVLLGLVAAAAEPLAGGRHKVFGHPDLAVVPTTSTIGSHLPRAVGVAYAIEHAHRLGVGTRWPREAVVVASIGDASVNHSTVQGAVNTVGHAAAQGVRLPLLLVVEDNGLGISVPSPPGWVRRSLEHRPGWRYARADGTDLEATYDATSTLVEHVRATRGAAVLHLECVRLFGHAGSDHEAAYRSAGDIAADEARDPLRRTAGQIVARDLLTAAEVEARAGRVRGLVRAAADAVVAEPGLASLAEVVAPLVAAAPDAVRREAGIAAADDQRRAAFGERLPEDEGPLTMAQTVNRTLTEVLALHREAFVLGQDVGRKGGVYGVTLGLRSRWGASRVLDTLLDEQAVLGAALGAALSGLLPLPEVQYLAYLHNAEDQVRGEAATLSFFSSGAYRNGLVLRVAGLADVAGFGGHFHNDDALAVLRDVPGILVAVPSGPREAAALLRTCVAAARVEGRVCVVVEPIARYHDKAAAQAYAPPSEWAAEHAAVGTARTHGGGDDVALVTFGNGVPLTLRVAESLTRQGVSAQVVDLRWVVPLPEADIVRAAQRCGRVLVVDETRRSGGVSEGVLAALVDAGFRGPMARVTAADSFVPIGPSARHVLLDEGAVLDAALALAQTAKSTPWASGRSAE